MFVKRKLSTLFKENIPFPLALLPPSSYMVGGAVRDALLNRRREYLDLDFVLATQAVETARKIANAYQAGFVLLDEQRQIARVVFKEGTADFALQEGESLEQDLQRRDFTVNAIAYNPLTQELIDPLQGLSDLETGTIRMVKKANLEDDPLRLLRAYRQASQLSFTIEPITRATLRHLAPFIKTVAAERVQTELNYLLQSPSGSPSLIAAGEDGLLQPWLNDVTPQALQQVVKVDEIAPLLNINGDAPRMAKLACLVSRNPEEAEWQLMTLKYSRCEIRTVTTALKHLPSLQTAQSHPLSRREQYFLFNDVRDVFPVLALFAAATGVNLETLTPLSEHYQNPNDAIAHPKPLVSGHDIMRSLSLRPSPLIGQLLTEIQIAHIENKIATPDEALILAKCLLDQQTSNPPP